MVPERGSLRSLISPRGFLPHEDPLTSFDTKRLRIYDEVSQNMPDQLANRTFRKEMFKLPVVDVSKLKGPELDRAWSIVSFAASGHVHQLNSPRFFTLPEGLAVPLTVMAKKLNKPPILAYDGYDLYNWKREDPNGPIEVDNLRILTGFTRDPQTKGTDDPRNGRDETRFINVHTEIEHEAAPALLRLEEGQQAALQGDGETLTDVLSTVNHSLLEMRETQKRMNEVAADGTQTGNDPNIYHKGFRPYIMGFNRPLNYTGVGYIPHDLRGETGAQSAIMPSFDAAMGIKHADTPMVKHTKDMRAYMPKNHRKFIAGLEANKMVIHDFVEQTRDSGLVEVYNSVVDNMAKFRSHHLDWSDEYISQKVEDQHGTGRTVFRNWLAQMMKETLDSKIQ